MSHYHAVVWLDHAQAHVIHVIHVSLDDVEKSIVYPGPPHQQLHVKSGALGAGRHAEDNAYHHAIVEALTGAKEILVVGPASAKLQLREMGKTHIPLIDPLCRPYFGSV